jgi:hypothetical protein
MEQQSLFIFFLFPTELLNSFVRISGVFRTFVPELANYVPTNVPANSVYIGQYPSAPDTDIAALHLRHRVSVDDVLTLLTRAHDFYASKSTGTEFNQRLMHSIAAQVFHCIAKTSVFVSSKLPLCTCN